MSETPSGARGAFLRDLGLATLAGVLTFAAFPTALAPDHTFWPLIWISHIPLLWVLKDKAPKQAFRWGLYCGTVINAGGYYWIATMLETFGGLHISVGLLGLALHSLWLGFIWALWAWGVNRIGNTTRVPIEWSVPIVMVAAEFAVPRIFPAYMGNSQYLFPPIMQICDLFGIAAVTFLIYRVNAVGFLWVRSVKEGRPRPKRATAVTVAMLAGALIYGFAQMHRVDARMEAAPKLKIGMVEGDVGIFQTATPDAIKDHLLIHQRLSAELEAQGAELIVWPESSYRYGHLPKDARQFPPSKAPLVADWREDQRKRTARADRAAPMRGFETPLLFGSTSLEKSEAPRWEGDGPYTPYNTAWLLDRDGTVVGTYDKVFLLVFGEYVPLAKYIPQVYEWIPAAGNLAPGTRLEVIETDIFEAESPLRLGVLICYEGLLPRFTRPLVVEGRPHVLINITNDDWFGKTAERYLHLALTVPRAIEHRLAFVRSTLTGVSVFVDANGRQVSMTRPDDPETLIWDTPLMQSATVYQIIGDAFSWACLLLALGFYGFGRWRRR